MTTEKQNSLIFGIVYNASPWFRKKRINEQIEQTQCFLITKCPHIHQCNFSTLTILNAVMILYTPTVNVFAEEFDKPLSNINRIARFSEFE